MQRSEHYLQCYNQQISKLGQVMRGATEKKAVFLVLRENSDHFFLLFSFLDETTKPHLDGAIYQFQTLLRIPVQ